MSGPRVLDEIQSLAQLDAFDPASFFGAADDAAPPAAARFTDVGGELDGARGLLAEVDRFTQKAMRIRLNHLSDPLPPQLRTLLYSTIISYENDAALLRDRVAAMLGRIDPRAAAALTGEVCDAAARVLALRAALRRGVLERARRHAAAWLPAARKAARDRTQADEERENWSRARVDLEQVAARAETIEAGSFAERIRKIEPPVQTTDEPPEEDDPTSKRFSLLELD